MTQRLHEVVYTKHASTLYLPRGDEWIAPAMKAGTYWEENILKAMLEALPPGGTYVDAGSFVGTHAVPMSRLAGTVLAFEPQRHIFQMLCTNAVVNNVPNLWAFNAALGHLDHALITMNGTVPDGASRGKPLTFGGNNNAINYGGTNIGAGGDVAEMRTLDSVYAQLAGLPGLGCDVLKVDVQGAEPLMFWGARAVIARHKPVIFYEVDSRFGVTPEMRAQMPIPDEVANFDITQFCADLGYSAPCQLGPCDWVMRPLL